MAIGFTQHSVIGATHLDCNEKNIHILLSIKKPTTDVVKSESFRPFKIVKVFVISHYHFQKIWNGELQK